MAMTTTTVSEEVTHRWYARPVLFVADVNRALRFYIDLLGFKKAWHEGDGRGTVCQVHRGECEIILCEDASRRDKGRLFVSLTREGLAELRGEIVETTRSRSSIRTATSCCFPFPSRRGVGSVNVCRARNHCLDRAG